MRRAKNKITYHGRTGRPMVHRTRTGREFMMVRANGGGTKRLYEGSRYRTNTARKGQKPTYKTLVLR